MSVRYGVASSSYCGPRTVAYQPDGCIECLSFKIGEKQIFDVDFGDEVRCNARRRGCIIDYDELVSVTSFNAVPETVFGGVGSIAVSLSSYDSRSGVVKLLIDATNINLRNDEKWKIDVTVQFESGRCLKQCFQVRLIDCGSSCDTIPQSCNGPILASISNCSDGVLLLSDEAPVNTVCAVISATCDSIYTLDGTPPCEDGVSPIPLAAGVPLTLLNLQDIANFRLANADGDCHQICVSRVYRGSC